MMGDDTDDPSMQAFPAYMAGEDADRKFSSIDNAPADRRRAGQVQPELLHFDTGVSRAPCPHMNVIRDHERLDDLNTSHRTIFKNDCRLSEKTADNQKHTEGAPNLERAFVH